MVDQLVLAHQKGCNHREVGIYHDVRTESGYTSDSSMLEQVALEGRVRLVMPLDVEGHLVCLDASGLRGITK